MLRINVGPVFTVMNDCKYAEGNNEMFFGSMRRRFPICWAWG